jgi:GNAT superfamily N-acetyltransferase
MNFNKKISLTILLTCAITFPQHKDFKAELSKGWFYNETKISYVVDNSKVGSIYAVHLPRSNYILHTFFIAPQCRNQGYGTELLIYALNYLKQKDANKIFIQAGPFEIINDQCQNIAKGNERNKKLQQLVNLYKKVGFKLAPVSISKIAWLIYKVGGIDEDSKYLMIIK